MTIVNRGVRGATTADSNSAEDILRATRELLALMIRHNGIEAEDVASAVFSTTPDLTAVFPALAARQLGWLEVPLLCYHEIGVPGSLAQCVRIMINWNTNTKQSDIKHIYIKEARQLRPDLCYLPPVDWEELENWINDHMDETTPSKSRDNGK